AYGTVRMITAINYTDYMYRPRRPEELVTEIGGGVLFSQAAHQLDIVRLLAGGRLPPVRAGGGARGGGRATPGGRRPRLTFEDGAFASVAYSGYGHFDSDEFCGFVSEAGARKDARRHGAARQALAQASSPTEEAALKHAASYGGAAYAGPSAASRLHQHF